MLRPLASVLGAPIAEGTSRSVVLLTDGEVGNEAEVMELVRSNSANTRFFAVGIGAGPNDHLVRGLARAGGGAAAFISPGERIGPRVLAIFKQAVSPRVSDLRIDWGGTVEQAPSAPAMVLDEPMTAWARLTLGAVAPVEVTVTVKVGGTATTWRLAVVDARGLAQLPAPTLWARERIRGIEETHAGVRGSRQKRTNVETWKQEVIALAREFGLSSSLTSWIAIEEREEKDKQTGELVLRKVPALVTIGWHGMGYFGVRAKGALSRKMGGQAMGALSMKVGRSTRGSYTGLGRAVFRLGPPEPSDDTVDDTMGSMLIGSAPLGAASMDSIDTDQLLFILSLQRVDGGFDLTDDHLQQFGLDGTIIMKAPAGVHGDSAEVFRVLHTALVLALLDAWFADARDTWFSAVKKSRAWLKKAAIGWGPVVDGRTVTQWARAVVAAAAAPGRE